MVHEYTDNAQEASEPPAVGVEAKICQTFPENCRLMIAIAKAESGLNPNAKHINNNGTVDQGIFQINSVHGDDNLLDVDNNLKVARRIYDTQGLGAWYAWRDGKHLKFM